MGSSIRRAGAAVPGAAVPGAAVPGAAVPGATGQAGTAAVAAPDAPAVGEAARQDREALQQAMGELAASGAAGVQVRVHDQQGDWTGSSGVKELDRDENVPVDGRFRAGSITKTFVSTVILQLVGEGKVELDGSVDRCLPQFGLDKRITVRMLLQHTSGIFNYTGEVKPDGSVEPGLPLTGEEFLNIRFRTYQPEELVTIALAKPARFEPGKNWSYSNTNYVLAGLLIEKLTGTPYAEEVESRMLGPLGLRETTLPGTRYGIPDPHAHGYFAYQQDGQPKVIDITRLNPSWAHAAGEIISTTKDLDTFISGLLDGTLLEPELLAEMRTMHPVAEGVGYGLGLFQVDAGAQCGGAMLGHTGGVHGYTSYLFNNADRSKSFEMSVTTGDVDESDTVAAEKFYNAMEKVATVAFCGSADAASRGMTKLPALRLDRF